MTDLEVYRSNIARVAEVNGVDVNQVEVIHRSVAKGTTLDELNYFMNVASSVGMSPFNKEIWCYKSKGQLLVFAGRDGFLRKAQESPSFNGLRSCEVCKNDEFVIDVANNQIKHNMSFGDRGPIVGAYCIVFRKGGEPTIETVEFGPYNKGMNAWKTHPAEMIKKVAEVHALKKAFGISGVQCEHDFTQPDNNGNVEPVNTIEIKSFIDDQQCIEISELCEVSQEVAEGIAKKFGTVENIPENKFEAVKKWAVELCTK